MGQTIKNDFVRNKTLYFMILPVIALYIIFCYMPMYGEIIAFEDFKPQLGILGSPWVGLKHFKSFFESPSFLSILGNTFRLSLSSLVFGFPAPILLALLLNELHQERFAKVVQNFTYMPHFISTVVISSMILSFVSSDGLINQIRAMFGGESISYMIMPQYFRTIYVVSNVWQTIGWGSIIYIAALAGVDQELYEAATIDGAGRWKQMLNVTLPGIAPTILILLIMRIGQLLSIGYEKIILLYNPTVYETADVISTYVYRRGLLEGGNYGYSAAVGMFNSVINFILLASANKISRKLSGSGLW